MSIIIKNIENKSRKIVAKLENYCVVEYVEDITGAPQNASEEFFNNKTGLRRRQLFVQLDGKKELVTQAGALLWVAGNVELSTGVKNPYDFVTKFFKGKVTKESTVKPEYKGVGVVAMEPLEKFIILQDVSLWGERGMIVEDGMFYACDKTVKHSLVQRTNISSAALGNEGLFNLNLSGSGIVALESYIPQNELIEVEIVDDVLKIDGSYAVCWSATLEFTVEPSSDSIIGSIVNKEGLVNVYRGTGKVLISGVKSIKDVKSVDKKG